MKKFDVLIVEDDVDLSEALCETLEIKGYQVISAKNGHEALSQLCADAGYGRPGVTANHAKTTS